MLTVYRRHSRNCKNADDRYAKKDKCSLWAEGTVEGKYLRRSLKTRSWERAHEIVKDIERGKVEQQSITVEYATQAFIKDCESRNLGKSTLGKYRRLMRTLVNFVADVNYPLCSFEVDKARSLRNTWQLSARTTAKELERLRAFFNFCVENDWMKKNPAKGIKAPQVKTLPRLPFSEDEVNNILSQAENDKELAFLMVLRHTGLRIGDASMLKVSEFTENRIYLYTTKAGTPVSIVIPDQLVSLLKSLPTTAGHFFLWGQSTHVHSVSNLWRRRIKAICKDLGITPDHPHRFRHSLAADLLMKGASVEDVAAILGNSPAVVQKTYSQWIKGRQDRLDAIVAATWSQPKLVRVK